MADDAFTGTRGGRLTSGFREMTTDRMLFIVLIVVVIIFMIATLVQNSSGGNSQSSPNQNPTNALINPLGTAMRTNPLVNVNTLPRTT